MDETGGRVYGLRCTAKRKKRENRESSTTTDSFNKQCLNIRTCRSDGEKQDVALRCSLSCGRAQACPPPLARPLHSPPDPLAMHATAAPTQEPPPTCAAASGRVPAMHRLAVLLGTSRRGPAHRAPAPAHLHVSGRPHALRAPPELAPRRLAAAVFLCFPRCSFFFFFLSFFSFLFFFFFFFLFIY